MGTRVHVMALLIKISSNKEQETKISEQQQPASTAAPTGHDAALASSMPEAILGTGTSRDFQP
jgi:hypothetical protein